MSQALTLAEEHRRLQAENQQLRDEIAQLQAALQSAAETEAALKDSQDRYQALLAALHEGVVFQDATGAIHECNPSAEALLGLSRDQMMGRTSIDPRWAAIHPDGRPFPGDTHPAMVALRTGQPLRNVVMGVRRPDADVSWISINAQPLFRPEADTPYAVVASFSDITAQRHSYEAQRTLVALIEASSELIGMASLDERLSFLNPAGRHLIGVNAEFDIATLTIWDVVAPDYHTLMRETVLPALFAQGSWQGELAYIQPLHKQPITVHADVFLINDPHTGAPAAIATVSQDLTARLHLERSLTRMNQLLRLMHQVSSIANGSATLQAALADSMPAILATGAWELAHVYAPSDEDPTLLRSTGWWYGPLVEQFLPFRTVTERLQIPSGQGLPGTVFASGNPNWIVDMQAPITLERAQCARELGVRTACAFPIRMKDQIIAVLELFACIPLPEDPDLMEVMGNIGTQLGRVVERQRARETLLRQQLFLEVVLNGIEDGIIACNQDGTVTLINRATALFHALTPPYLPIDYSLILANLFHADARTPITLHDAPLWRARHGERVRDLELVIAPKGHPPRYVLAHGQPLRSADGDYLGAVVALHDITQAKQLEQQRQSLLRQLQSALARTESLYQIARIAIENQPLDTQLTHAVNLTVEVLQADRITLIVVDLEHELITEFISAGPGRADIHTIDFPEVMRGLSGWVIRHRTSAYSPADFLDDREAPDVRARREATRCGDIMVAPVIYHNTLLGTLTAISPSPGTAYSAADVELLEAFAVQIAGVISHARLLHDVQQAAITDALTAVYNRRGWFALAQPFWEQSLRTRAPLSVLMLDVDFFKRVNDTYGHSSGDRVLQAIASLCASLVRPMDLVGRYGGEEFVVLLPGADAATAHEVAERLRQGIATTPIALPQGSLTITVSLGYATRTAAHPDLPHLVDCADTALYAAKAAGRNCTRRWAPDPPPEGAAP